jgi:hypothetical protein
LLDTFVSWYSCISSMSTQATFLWLRPTLRLLLLSCQLLCAALWPADVDLHFWDSPDDIQGASMDLLFERDRVYLHKATGSFGAIPLSVSGEATSPGGGGRFGRWIWWVET